MNHPTPTTEEEEELERNVLLEDTDRWHANHITPNYVPVRPATKWSDLCKPFQYNKEVLSLPFHWLQQQQEKEQQNGGGQEQKHSTPSIREILNIHGFLVVSNVLSQTECDEAMELAWDWIETASIARYNMEEEEKAAANVNASASQPPPPINNLPQPPVSRYNKPSTTTLSSSQYFPQSLENGGLIPYYGSGHSTFAWRIRSNPKVKNVFEHVHSDSTATPNNILLSSLDAVILWPRSKKNIKGGWFHVDQNPSTKPGFVCVQGLVNLLPNSGTPQTGGNVMVAQSHTMFPQHYTTTTTTATTPNNNSAYHYYYQQRLKEMSSTTDFLKVDPLDDVLLGRSNASKIISCELQAGDMLLWDSRTVHCSYPPNANANADASTTSTSTTATNTDCGSNNNNNSNNNKKTTAAAREGGLLRAATVVSMIPSAGISAQVLQQRKRAVEECQTLTHWVDKCSPFFDDEQSTNYKLERSSVAAMKQLQEQEQHPTATISSGSGSSAKSGTKKVLLTFDDLSPVQKALVVGSGEEET